VLLVISAWLAVSGIRSVEPGDTPGVRVRSAQLATETVLSTLEQAETGRSGYLLTGDPTYLEPYRAAQARLEQDFGRLEEAAALGDIERAHRIGRIRQLAGAELDAFGRAVALRQAGHPEAALDIVRTDQGKRDMDAIRGEVAALQAGADQRLAQARADSRPVGLWLCVIGLASVACALLGWVALVQHRARVRAVASLARLGSFTRAFGLAQGMMRGTDGRITFWSDGNGQLYGYSAEEALGRISHDLLATEFPQPLAEIEATLLRSGRWQGDLLQRHKSGTTLHVMTHWVLHRSDTGQPDGVIEVHRDITPLRRVEALLHTIIETAPALIFAKDRQGRMLLANQAVLALLGKDWEVVKGQTDREFLGDAGEGEAIMANDQRLMASGSTEMLEERVGETDGLPRVWFSAKAPLRDAAAEVVGLVGVSVEITERKRAEDHLRLIIGELNHRVKNMLASVQSITGQTLRGGDPAIGQALEGRLQALSIIYTVLTNENWQGAFLGDVIRAVLAPHGCMKTGRLQADGPKLRLSVNVAQALSMTLHELANNAVQWGALSNPTGTVAVAWEMIKADEPTLVRLTWTERGGPLVRPPVGRGFGMRLIERGLARSLEGRVQLSFNDPAGVCCLIEAPLAKISAPAEVLPFVRAGALHERTG
jgi:PAS domain S-box-containing protein